ncbi:hypothetical protein AVEN_111911-1 [Araneus ventricosus]|uniref:Uncharacterized protein n=1 Tax=Araneus ventricosus TaxID=182803 RepID=A0A4Y2VKM1_ARAVE|nr:hypothetical protein AVEN_111911-1 [Araneus ventricosus]
MEESVCQRSECLNTVNSCKACDLHTRTSGPISLSFEREFAKLQPIRMLDRIGVFRHTYPSKDYGGKLNTLIPLTETASHDEANVYQSEHRLLIMGEKQIPIESIIMVVATGGGSLEYALDCRFDFAGSKDIHEESRSTLEHVQTSTPNSFVFCKKPAGFGRHDEPKTPSTPA